MPNSNSQFRAPLLSQARRNCSLAEFFRIHTEAEEVFSEDLFSERGRALVNTPPLEGNRALRATAKKIQCSMPRTESIRRAIWQGNRISNNDATLIIMRLPPYSSICPLWKGRKIEANGWVKERRRRRRGGGGGESRLSKSASSTSSGSRSDGEIGVGDSPWKSMKYLLETLPSSSGVITSLLPLGLNRSTRASIRKKCLTKDEERVVSAVFLQGCRRILLWNGERMVSARVSLFLSFSWNRIFQKGVLTFSEIASRWILDSSVVLSSSTPLTLVFFKHDTGYWSN